jgi:hypothetical protein
VQTGGLDGRTDTQTGGLDGRTDTQTGGLDGRTDTQTGGLDGQTDTTKLISLIAILQTRYKYTKRHVWATESVFVLSLRSNILTYSVRPIGEGTLNFWLIVKDKTFIRAIYNLSTIYAGAAEIVESVTATGYWVDGLVFKPWCGRDFPNPSLSGPRLI